MTARTAAVSTLVVLCSLHASTLFAAPWTPRPSRGVPTVAARTHGLRDARTLALRGGARATGPASRVSVPDGAGGLYIMWIDFRDGSSDVFVLRETAAGVPAAGWPADGVVACGAHGDQFDAILIPDGAGGAIAAWVDYRDNVNTGDGYAQRINPAGVPQWAANGVKIIDGLNSIDAAVAPDGTGGILAAWSEQGASDADIFATRLNGTGAVPAGWASVLVCNAADDQAAPQVATGAAGEAIIAWEDPRSGTDTHVYAQRLNASAAAQWGVNGKQVDASTISIQEPAVVSDGGGGAFFFWMDFGGTDRIMGQHYDAAGNETWTAGGLGVSGSAIADGGILATTDAAGGSIVCWAESPGTVNSIRAQRVSALGAAQWGAGGTSIVSVAGSEPYVDDVVPVGSGVAYFLWEDIRNDNNGDIYVQHVNATGIVQMTVNGVAACGATGSQYDATGAPDGAGGVLIAWLDERNRDTDVFTQRYSPTGVEQFAANGKAAFSNPGVQLGSLVLQTDDGGALVVWNEKRNGQYDIRGRKFDATGAGVGPAFPICISAGHQEIADMVDDGAGGAIVAWLDYSSGQPDIYAQRLDINGGILWTPNGVPVCTAAGSQAIARMICPAPGTAIIAWDDQRNGAVNPDIYAQRLNSSGVAQWTANGKPACTNAGAQTGCVIASDGAGGAIIAWADLRNFLGQAIYAQRLNVSGDPQWTLDGENIATFPLGAFPRVSAAVPGLSNDAIILINDSEVDLGTGEFKTILYAQKVNSAGTEQWGALGSTVCDATSTISFDQMTGDNAGGAYVGWSDDRNGRYDIYLQRVNAAGTVQLTPNGKVVCNAGGWEYLSGIMHDAGGDAYLSWYDTRNGYPDIFVQRSNLAGAFAWTANGKAVCTAARGQYIPAMYTKTAVPGRMMIAWTDNRAGNERYVFVQRLELVNGDSQWTGDGVTGTTLALVSASAEPGRVRLAWFASASVSATVYRRTAEQDWASIGTAYSDGEGLVTFEDLDVVPGTRYEYRLGFVEGGQEIFAGDVWIEVPTNLRLAIDGLQPNPAVKDLLVSFTLPSRAPASLEMIDVTGRRVLARDLGDLPAGRHTLRLDERPPAGVYFIRLTQKATTVTAKAAVMR